MEAIVENIPLLLRGIGYTVALTVLGYLLALIVGTALAVCRVSPIPPLRWAATVYVEIFRNIPLLSLLILIAFGLPDVGLRLPYFWCGVLGLTLSSAAFVCENVRSGINTVPVGHAEAARSIGLGFFGTLRFVVLPQAFRSMIQPLVNVFIGTVIGSALCSAIAVSEITWVTQTLNIQYAQAVLMFLVAGAVYLGMSLGGAALGGALERAVSPDGPADGGRDRRTLDVAAGAQA
ncbi:amino acid ABC transporter permease [Brachybacterium sp. P6-10-X1]|uniref:amino acid ABC transporter permease n=1 Tax=Brachybacterium sp. P6-10-X1 TaxID=1903186 RepID=UPI000971B48A|nr:amino acid ABC transporter permease [Brachybacterium sp. P6-10-X1]APX33330.1 amino acid ABC transporter permease [Brachybacterium sp. P6-10-X1]